MTLVDAGFRRGVAFTRWLATRPHVAASQPAA
jgi:hypothetical protein